MVRAVLGDRSISGFLNVEAKTLHLSVEWPSTSQRWALCGKQLTPFVSDMDNADAVERLDRLHKTLGPLRAVLSELYPRSSPARIEATLCRLELAVEAALEPRPHEMPDLGILKGDPRGWPFAALMCGGCRRSLDARALIEPPATAAVGPPGSPTAAGAHATRAPL